MDNTAAFEAAPSGASMDFFGNITDPFVSMREKYGIWPTTIWTINPLDPSLRDMKKLLDDGATREGVLHSGDSKSSVYGNSVSVFNPAYATAILNCYGPPPGTGLVYDSFGGGGTRAIMAAKRGHYYTGMELRPDQVAQVQHTAMRLGVGDKVNLVCGDARHPPHHDESADFHYTCPPYHDLEVYNGGEGDLSMCDTYDEFLAGMHEVAVQTMRILKPGATSAWVIGLHRDKRGSLLPMNGDLSAIHRAVGFEMLEEVILTQDPHPGMQRIGMFDKGSKRLIRVHEYCLVYRKPARPAIKGVAEPEQTALL